jgi:hypothetical protein
MRRRGVGLGSGMQQIEEILHAFTERLHEIIIKLVLMQTYSIVGITAISKHDIRQAIDLELGANKKSLDDGKRLKEVMMTVRPDIHHVLC